MSGSGGSRRPRTRESAVDIVTRSAVSCPEVESNDEITTARSCG